MTYFLKQNWRQNGLYLSIGFTQRDKSAKGCVKSKHIKTIGYVSEQNKDEIIKYWKQEVDKKNLELDVEKKSMTLIINYEKLKNHLK